MPRLVVITLLPDNDEGARVCNSTPPRRQTVPFVSLFMASLRADPPVGDADAFDRATTSESRAIA
jgi:hypothetical protein